MMWIVLYSRLRCFTILFFEDVRLSMDEGIHTFFINIMAPCLRNPSPSMWSKEETQDLVALEQAVNIVRSKLVTQQAQVS